MDALKKTLESLGKQHPNARSLAGCGDQYTKIRMAIDYDSSFCLDFGGGSDDGARARVDSIIAAANAFFQADDLCLQLEVCLYDGECSNPMDPTLDPFLDLVSSAAEVCAGSDPNLLFDYTNYYNARPPQGCNVRHMFFSTNPYNNNDYAVGCAWSPSICDPYAYAVEHVGFTSQVGLQAILVSHFLGHNLNAVHVEGDQYIMQGLTLDGGETEFAPTTMSQMNSFIDSITDESCFENPEGSPAPAAPPVASPYVRTDKTCYVVGEPVEITYMYTSCNNGDWVGIYDVRMLK